MNKIIIIFFLFGFLFSEFIPSISTKLDEDNLLILSNYFINYEHCEIADTSKDLQLTIKNDSLIITQINPASGLEIINLNCEDEIFNLVINKRFTKNIKFNYPSINNGLKVNLMGSFNDWDRHSHPMIYKDNNYRVIKNFTPGKYEYKFVINGNEILDPNNSDSLPNGLGGWNSILNIENKIDKNHGVILKSKYQINDSLVHIYFQLNSKILNEKLNIKKTYLLLDNQLLNKNQFNITSFDIEVIIPDSISGRLRIIAENNFGQILRENHTILTNGLPINTDDKNNFQFTVLYSIMVDRFHNGNIKNDNPIVDDLLHPLGNFHGGDIPGITRKIKEGYFSDLGINMLWISPILKGPENARVESVYPYRKYSGYHGYWPVSNNEIDERFGTSNDFKYMVEVAKDNNLDVIMDFVSNHVYEKHPYFIEHPEWFSDYYFENGELNLRKWDGDTRLTTWFESFLPTFDYENNSNAIDAVVEDALSLLKDYDLAGFRQDATKHVPHKFWKSLTKKIKEQNPQKEIFQIGETFGSDELVLSYVNPSELNSQFNFDLYFNARAHFSNPNSSFIEFNKRMKNNLVNYQPVNLMGTITSSHDQVRFMAFADNQIEFHENGTERAFSDLPIKVNNKSSYDKLFGFSVLNMVLPGIPVIYYGEEYGQIGANDPGNRLDMKFQYKWNSQERELNNKIKKVINLRKTNPAFALGDLEVLFENKNISAWKKTYFTEVILIIFNSSNDTEIIQLDLNNYRLLSSLIGNSEIEINSLKTNFMLEPHETRLYKLIK